MPYANDGLTVVTGVTVLQVDQCDLLHVGQLHAVDYFASFIFTPNFRFCVFGLCSVNFGCCVRFFFLVVQGFLRVCLIFLYIDVTETIKRRVGGGGFKIQSTFSYSIS